MDIDNLQDLRDVTIVAFTIAGTVAFLVGIVLLLVVGIVALRLMFAIRNAVENGMMPALTSFRETANSVRGTTAFIADTAVSPIIRMYSFYAGVRRVLGVLLGFGRRG